MSTKLATRPARQDHPPQPVHATVQYPSRRVNLLDRLALHVGVALIKWGRRPRATDSTERRRQHLARLEHASRAAQTRDRLMALGSHLR